MAESVPVLFALKSVLIYAHILLKTENVSAYGRLEFSQIRRTNARRFVRPLVWTRPMKQSFSILTLKLFVPIQLQDSSPVLYKVNKTK